MLVAGITLEASGADLDEGDTATVVRIHIGVYLEDKACEGWFVWRYFTLFRLDGTGGRSYFDEAI